MPAYRDSGGAALSQATVTAGAWYLGILRFRDSLGREVQRQAGPSRCNCRERPFAARGDFL